LHDRIISLGWAGWACKSTGNLTRKLYIEVPVLSKEIERSYICVLDFGVVVYFCFSFFSIDFIFLLLHGRDPLVA
jgi:hypothetical protein